MIQLSHYFHLLGYAFLLFVTIFSVLPAPLTYGSSHTIACEKLLAQEKSELSSQDISESPKGPDLFNKRSFNNRTPIGNKGFLTAAPYSGDTDAAVLSSGYVFNSVQIYVVDSVAAAKVHRDSFSAREPGNINKPYGPLQGFYLLIPGFKITEDSDATPYFGSFVSQHEKNPGTSLIWFDSQGEQQNVPWKTVSEIFDPSVPMEIGTLQNSNSEASPPNNSTTSIDSIGLKIAYFRQYGWVHPPQRAVIDYQDFINSSSSYRNLKRKIRKMIEDGFFLRLNGNFHKSMDIVYGMKRKEGIPNRYDELRYQETLKLYNKGIAFSIEVWGPVSHGNETVENQIVAGLIAIKNGGHIKVDTMFYLAEKGFNIDYAKFADFAILEWLHSQEVNWSDSGSRVTNYSLGMHAKHIPLQEFLERVALLPDELILPNEFSYLNDVLYQKSKNP